MDLKVSMWTSFFMDLSPEGAIEELAGCGWRYAELSHEHALVLLDRGRPEDVGERFREHAGTCGVAVPQGHLDLVCDISPAREADRRATVESLRRWLDLFMAAGIRDAVIHPGVWRAEGWESRREAQMASLSELVGHVRGSDVCLCLENCPSGEELKGLVAACDERHVGVCLDTGHLNLTSENQGDFIRHFGRRLRALHLAENDRSGDQHMMPYARAGSVPWEEVAQALGGVNYAGLLNYEVPGERACPLEIRRLKLAYLKGQAAWMFRTNERRES